MKVENKDVGFKKIDAKETDYGTGAKRDSRRGKGRMVWMPPDALFLISRIYEEGNIGRGERNWENGMPIEDFLDSTEHHHNAYIAGERKEPHLAQACWNAINALQTAIWVYLGCRPESLNNLPDHRNPWKPGDPSPCPLSDTEIEWLKKIGVIPIKDRPENQHLCMDCGKRGHDACSARESLRSETHEDHVIYVCGECSARRGEPHKPDCRGMQNQEMRAPQATQRSCIDGCDFCSVGATHGDFKSPAPDSSHWTKSKRSSED